MRIYDGEYTVRSIVEDCGINYRDSFALNTAGRIVHGIDLDKLNLRLRTIPVSDIRKRRTRMNLFYEEMMVTADPDRGISFSSCLMLLAQYNVIEDSRSLRLDEFLKRRARLQRVHESIRRSVVKGFFDTLYWSRRFRRAQNSHSFSRMAEPPQLPVPEIFVEDPDEGLKDSESTEPRDFTVPAGSSTSRLSDQQSTSSSFNLRGLPKLDTTLRRRDSAKASPTHSEKSQSPTPSPNLSPRRLFPTDTAYTGADRATSPSSPRPGHSRQGSAVSDFSAQGVMESFENSAWAESMRRSFSVRRPSYH